MKALSMVLIVLITLTLSACGKDSSSAAGGTSESPLQLTKPQVD